MATRKKIRRKKVSRKKIVRKKKGFPLSFIRRILAVSPKTFQLHSFDDLTHKEKMQFQHEGKGKFRVYVERESGGKDYYFPTRAKQEAFKEKMNAEYKKNDSDIYKVR